MISTKQIERTVRKLARLCTTLEDRLFTKVDEIPARWYRTDLRLHHVPDRSLFTDCPPDAEWGGEGAYCWLRGTYTPGPQLTGRRLYLYPRATGNEGMLWVDGRPFGIFTTRKPPDGSRGNHYCDLLTLKAEAGKSLDVALEFYAGHENIGTMPLVTETRTYTYRVGSLDVCVRDELIADVLFDLRVVVEMEAALDPASFRRADVLNALMGIHEAVYYDPDNVEEEFFREGLRQAQVFLKEILRAKNAPGGPWVGLIGHSHMDTAWLWPICETVKKCARTYANQLSLMEQYPEYLFVQSSAYHSEMIRRNYPDLFEGIRQKVREGRYEPNGGIWVECDCNLVSGESMARQFIWGQRYTRKFFNYTADTFWLPDTFGYSAAIPQIMHLAGVRYFLTTKMSWNDTNKFPYDTFYWQGLDGTRVLTHLNQSHLWPGPVNLMEYMVTGKRTGDCVREKTVSRQKLFSFGYGDGGGGPQFEMLEIARRVADIDGLPRTAYTTVSAFMRDLEQRVHNPSVYAGELYLELHRGTLTNQHEIKRNNRLAEIALHDLEYLSVRQAMAAGLPASGELIHPLTETLLVNQFHDILPGTCLPVVHERSITETTALITQARSAAADLLRDPGTAAEGVVTVVNTLSFPRNDVVYLDEGEYRLPEGARQQRVDSLSQGPRTVVGGLQIEPFSGLPLVRLKAGSAAPQENGNTGPFSYTGKVLETPFARVSFGEKGTIDSFLDKTACNRELRGEGYPLGTFLMAEDVPLIYDNWDVDADIECKYRDCTRLLERVVVSAGSVEFRIRSKYRLSSKSTLEQDMVFYADSPLVLFETKIDWQDHHRFLKAAFDTSVRTVEARHEIQFGFIRRSVFRNTDMEKAKFEVSNHKYTDLSESRYGITILNDCKYGISVYQGQMRLSLHKGGNRPDYRGDLGQHWCNYGFLPHQGGFSAETVVRPAYTFNYKYLIGEGRCKMPSLLQVEAPTVIAEAVKPCEDPQAAFIVRLYECEGSQTNTPVFIPGVREITETNLLEEATAPPVPGERIDLNFRPFEIKTLRVCY
ncbi:MAG: glycosyl hydrolase-related protein [Treponema sp.]|nr:glycosyl hydrolase-related protein [Treponema sp.]